MARLLDDVPARAAAPWLVLAIAGGAVAPIVLAAHADVASRVAVGLEVVGGLGVGILALSLGARRGAIGAGRAAAIVAVALVLVPAAAVASMLAFVALGLVLAVPPAAFVAAGVLAARRGASRRSRPVGAALGAVVVALACVVAGVLDGLVWLPRALAPTEMPLEEIYATLAEADEDTGVGFIVAWGGIAAAAVLVAAVAVLRRREGAARAAALVLAPVVPCLAVLPWWQFGLGMGLGDTFVAGGTSTAMPWLAVLTALLAGAVVRLGLQAPSEHGARSSPTRERGIDGWMGEEPRVAP